MRVLFVVVALVLAAVVMISVVKKTIHGSSCCGEREKPEPKIKASDRNKSHYPYHYIAEIEGMVCSNCARKVENTFHKEEGMFVKVNLSKKEADIYSKRILKRPDIAKMLGETSYVLIEMVDVSEKIL